MNKHILLVMKWLNNKDSVSREEREKNRREACAVYMYGDIYCNAYRAAFAAYNAAADSDLDEVASAAYWVDVYFDRTGESRNEYLKELGK